MFIFRHKKGRTPYSRHTKGTPIPVNPTQIQSTSWNDVPFQADGVTDYFGVLSYTCRLKTTNLHLIQFFSAFFSDVAPPTQMIFRCAPLRSAKPDNRYNITRRRVLQLRSSFFTGKYPCAFSNSTLSAAGLPARFPERRPILPLSDCVLSAAGLFCCGRRGQRPADAGTNSTDGYGWVRMGTEQSNRSCPRAARSAG